jgi:hypothetical protein
VDQVNYIVQKAWKALHPVMNVLKKEIGIQNSLAYTSLVRPVFEYGAACWDPCRGHISALDRGERRAAQFSKREKDSDWETLA